MRFRAALMLVAPLLLAAEKPVLVPDVSQRNIEIAYSFTGAEMLLFGAILYPGGRLPQGESPAQIVVVVKGPTQSILVREKEKVAGIWVNADRLRYRSAPVSTRSLRRGPSRNWSTTGPAQSTNWGSTACSFPPPPMPHPRCRDRFARGLVELKRRSGLYFEDPHAVTITDGVLYRARLTIPARVPVGRFTAETFLIRDGRVLTAAVRAIDIRKSGFGTLRGARGRPVGSAVWPHRSRAVGAAGLGRGMDCAAYLNAIFTGLRP